jgi:UDP-N-acetylmuramoyl-tripeptide--D-alanyl-D-alanine ligase
MADIIFWSTILFFFSHLLFDTFSWLSLWEEKEFKFSRLLIHLKETKKGRRLILGFDNVLKWIAIFSYGVTIFWEADLYYHLLVALIYLYLFIKIILAVYNRAFILPALSLNTVLIVFLTISVSTFLFVFSPLDKYLWMLIIDRLNPLIFAFFMGIFLIFFDFRQDTIINRAIDKLNKHRDLLTIAVVGSYAKGSTKEFITRILAIKFNVLENDTPFSNALGIARTIISRLTSRTQVFVVEMGGYKPQDIDEMSNIARPKMAVITGINDERAPAYGIIENLPRDGLVLLNGNDPNTASLYERIKYKKFIFSSEDLPSDMIWSPRNDIRAVNIKLGKSSISFDVHAMGRKYRLSGIKLIGAQNVENLLPGIFIGLYLGIDFALIRRELGKLVPLPRTMDPFRNSKGAILIDDTYNTHINSIKTALEYMKLYRGKRILVLEPLSELGKNANSGHLELGKEIGRICDYLLLTNDNYLKSLTRGIQEEKSLCAVSVLPPVKIAKFIEKECARGDVVVFEGKEAYNSFSLIAAEAVLRV